MLDIIIEFRKGILFVRLGGDLIRNTIQSFHDEVTNTITENGIYNIVFNFDNLKSIDFKGMNAILYCYEVCSKKNGEVVICGNINDDIKNRLNKARIFNYMKQVSSELDVLETIEI